MKLHEQFVDRLLHAVRASQGKDPAAATAVIQDALRAAGLMGAAPSAAQDTPPPFVDLNAAPAWARKAEQAQHTQAGAAPDWRAFLRQGMPARGQAEEAPDLDAPGRFLHGSFGNEAGSRRYRLYVPAAPADGPRPLLVMLHGCTQDPADFAAGTGMNALAERHGCLVLYPEQAASANHSRCWNWFDAGHQQRGQGEPAILAGMMRDVVREHGADPARVYVAGLSAGGAMAAVMGAAYPELVAAVGVHSGLAVGSARDLITGLQAMKGAQGKRAHGAVLGMPLIVFHGDQDAVVHPSNGASVLGQFTHGAGLGQVEERGRAASGRTHTRTVFTDGGGRAMAEHWVLHGAGHAWAGGRAAGSHTDPAGPDASAEMLRFFLAHSLR